MSDQESWVRSSDGIEQRDWKWFAGVVGIFVIVALKVPFFIARFHQAQQTDREEIRETQSLLSTIDCLAHDGPIPTSMQDVLARLQRRDNCGYGSHRDRLRTLTDAWDRPLIIEEIHQAGPPPRTLVKVTSLGPDGQRDTLGDHADDLSIWFVTREVAEPPEDIPFGSVEGVLADFNQRTAGMTAEKFSMWLNAPPREHERLLQGLKAGDVDPWELIAELPLSEQMNGEAGLILFLAGESAGDAPRGHFTDPDPANPELEFWSDGTLALADQDGDGRFDAFYEIRKGRLSRLTYDRFGKAGFTKTPFREVADKAMAGTITRHNWSGR